MEQKENEFATIEKAIAYAEERYLNFKISLNNGVYVVTDESEPKQA